MSMKSDGLKEAVESVKAKKSEERMVRYHLFIMRPDAGMWTELLC